MKKLIVIGGGFAGASICKSLENKFSTILIDQEDFFEFTPSILKTIIDPNYTKKIQVKHKDYLKNTKLIKGKVTNVTKKDVTIKNKKLNFDYLVICTGSRYEAPFKGDDLTLATKSDYLMKKSKNVKKEKNISVIGGGLVGVELAAELAVLKNKNITIIHSHERLLERNTLKTSKYAEKFFAENNINIIFNDRAENKSNGNIKTMSGKKIPTDEAFLCIGIKPNSNLFKSDFKPLNEKNCIKVNTYLQIEKTKNIFAAGDVNSIFEEKTAQAAEKQAKIVIQNILNLENKTNLKEYKPKKRAIIISLGDKKAILEKGNFVLTGYFPSLIKKYVEWKSLRKYK